MRAIDLSAATWRKSSYSNPDGGACVEISDDFPGVVPVRDSKRPNGPAVIVSADSWIAFVSAIRSGQLAA